MVYGICLTILQRLIIIRGKPRFIFPIAKITIFIGFHKSYIRKQRSGGG